MDHAVANNGHDVRLEVQSPEGKRTIELTASVTRLGRADQNDVQIGDRRVSKRHAEILRVDVRGGLERGRDAPRKQEVGLVASRRRVAVHAVRALSASDGFGQGFEERHQ